MTNRNPILATDSYKFSHFMQYPPGATDVSSYIEARGTKIEGVTEVVFFGLQMYINEVLRTRVTKEHVERAAAFCAQHGTPFNKEGWNIIVDDHGGYLPLIIEAVPEGTPVPLHNVMVQVHTTDERLPWLTSYVETVMLSYIWYGSTVATVSREIKKVIKAYLDLTSDNPEQELPFKLHDFGYRGVAAGAAGLGGLAHLVNFIGTDNVAGIEAGMEHYGSGVCGYSISASEHSTMTSWGRDGEYQAYENMVKAYAKPGSIFACVIDSYDTYNAIKLWAQPQNGNKSLLEQVKDAGATVVLRPDSGDPVQMPIDVIKLLIAEVGAEWNSKGYLVLPDHVRVIQGDGIDIDDIAHILNQLALLDISASNIAFGMGGGLLQKVNRDTFKFAMKASAIEIYGEWHDVKKDPVTAPDKVSKAGRLDLLQHKETGEYRTVRKDEAHDLRKDGWYPAMHCVYSVNKKFTAHATMTLEAVRKNANIQ